MLTGLQSRVSAAQPGSRSLRSENRAALRRSPYARRLSALAQAAVSNQVRLLFLDWSKNTSWHRATAGLGVARFELLYRPWRGRHRQQLLPRVAPGSRRILGGFGAVPGLPGPFAALARQVAGQITDVTDCSWPRDSSAVWRIASAYGGCWYLKRHSSDRFHTREMAALQDWAPALGPDRAPELAAADPELLIMVITAVPGRPVLELQLSTREEREVHRQAGLLLGHMHESTHAPGPAPTSPA